MVLKYLGQNGFLFELGGKTIVTDPFITGNPLAEEIDVASLEVDYILLTHGHGDHVADVESIARNNNAKIISNYELVQYYGEKGFEGHPMNHGGKWTFEFGTVKYVNAVHSSVLPDGTYGGNPGGFVIWNEDISFYIAGDTALTLDMQLIPKTCPKLQFAILPIGDNFTMGVDDAVMAAEFVDCNKIVGCHYNTFGFIEINTEEAVEKFKEAGKELLLTEVGGTLEV